MVQKRVNSIVFKSHLSVYINSKLWLFAEQCSFQRMFSFVTTQIFVALKVHRRVHDAQIILVWADSQNKDLVVSAQKKTKL